MSEDKSREQFEAWFNENHWNPLADPEDGEGNCDGFLKGYDKESNEYQEDHTNEMWFAWQACAKIRDAQVFNTKVVDKEVKRLEELLKWK